MLTMLTVLTAMTTSPTPQQSAQLVIDRSDMKIKKAAFEATPSQELNNVYFAAQSKFEEIEKRMERINTDFSEKDAQATDAMGSGRRAESLKAKQEKLLEEIFGGSYGSEMEAQLEELADYQTLAAADAVCLLCFFLSSFPTGFWSRDGGI